MSKRITSNLSGSKLPTPTPGINLFPPRFRGDSESGEWIICHLHTIRFLDKERHHGT